VPFGLSHLSAEAVAAHADGMLPRGPAARAERHLAECPECRTAVQEQREAVLALRLAPVPGVPSALMERLRTLPVTTPLSMPALLLSPDGQPSFPAYSPQPQADAQAQPLHRPLPEREAPAQPAPQDPTGRVRGLGMFVIAAAVVTAGTVAASVAATSGAPAANTPAVPAARTVGTVGAEAPAAAAPSALAPVPISFRTVQPSARSGR
jgi:hypothetical protein